MTANEYNRRNAQRQHDLITDYVENPPKTQTEKDIYNLKYMLYGIGYGSLYFRLGNGSTLQRAIKRLEEIAREEKEKTQTPPR